MNSVKEYDVIICGGGTSGCSAAISAARAGADTLLIERLGSLGGQMNISGPPGFSYAHLFNAYNEQDVGGIIEETYNRLYESGHALPHIKTPYRLKAGFTFSYVDPDWWGLLIFEMMEENNVNLLLHSLVVDVLKEGNTVKGVVVENANGRIELRGKIIIDCTGEGDIAVRAGASSEIVSREEIQPHTVAFTVDGVDWDKLCKFIRENPQEMGTGSVQNPYTGASSEEIMEVFKKLTDITEIGEVMGFETLMNEALKKGDWHPFSGVGFFLMPKEGGKILAHMQHSTQVSGCLPIDAWDLTRAEVECRKQLIIAWRFFKNYMPGFENAYITRICPELRIREGRRIMGDYKLTKEDICEARKFEDVIGKSHFQAGGFHVATKDTVNFDVHKKIEYTPKDSRSYDIPYRCLVPLNVENFLVAGKMVSTDRYAYLRFLQQTMVTGQAAGVAAAICATKNITPRDLEKDVSELQRILIKQGAILKGTH